VSNAAVMHLFDGVGVLKSFRSRIRSCWPSFVVSVRNTSCVKQKPETASTHLLSSLYWKS